MNTCVYPVDIQTPGVTTHANHEERAMLSRNKTARTNHYATVPREQVQRSKFRMPQTRKQAFNASELIPIMCEEILPGDVWQHTEHVMARLATPIAPVVDDLALETFYFFVPNRIVWPTRYISDGDDEGWEVFITGYNGHGESTIPNLQIRALIGASDVVPVGSVLDHFGIPPSTYTNPMQITGFPVIGYFMIYNEWFRDQNLQEQWEWPVANPINTTQIELPIVGTPWDQMPLRINKRHDYFTASAPWPQKGTAVQMPLGATAPVVVTGDGKPTFRNGISTTDYQLTSTNGSATTTWGAAVPTGATMIWEDPKLQVDLATATGATLNAMRLAVTTQQFLELDARGGSRYVENLMGHWGVRAKDFRLNRSEYLGGSKIPITVNPIAQTNTTTTATQLGNLAAEMHASGSNRTFTYAAEEHGYIIGVAAARATPTYQQGIRRHWIIRQTRLDYPDPIFANLGEQAVDTREIYAPTNLLPALPTWGYNERFGECRVIPNEITGVLRSTAPNPMDWWHYAEEFASEPALNDDFITDKTQETLARSLATDPEEVWQAQIIMDILHDNTVARLLPAYGVPGLLRF